MNIHLGNSVSLRPFRPSDRDDIVAGLNDWQVTRWLSSVPHPYRVDHAASYLGRPKHRLCAMALSDRDAILALALCDDDRVIGGISLVTSERRPGDREFGFWLSRRVWGQGVMTRAVGCVIDMVRHHAPETGIAAAANRDNIRSQKLIRAHGFEQDGQTQIFSRPLQRHVTIICFRRPCERISHQREMRTKGHFDTAPNLTEDREKKGGH